MRPMINKSKRPNTAFKSYSSMYSCIPVSYTHLDVYKRQMHSFAYRIIRFHDKTIQRESCKAYRDMEKVVRRLIKDMFALELSGVQLRRLMRQISTCRTMMMSEREISSISVEGIDFPAFLKAYDKFKSCLLYTSFCFGIDFQNILCILTQVFQIHRTI